ncbi:nicotinamidase [Thermodesulfobacteriota bacterium]
MSSNNMGDITLMKDDALIIVDMQKDFLSGGKLAVPEGDKIIPAINRYIEAVRLKGMRVFATRDWHPSGHSSFQDQGGPWPAHCVTDTEGAQFADDLRLPADALIISTGTAVEKDGYSGFDGTDLDEQLRSVGISRLYIGGLATDYCVLNTVKDAIKLGYRVILLQDCIRAVNVNPDDGEKALEEMIRHGAVPVRWEMIG